MRKLFSALPALLLLLSGYGQAHADSAQLLANAKEQASAMAELLVKKDYRGFAEYMHPKTLRDGGGKEKIISLISTAMKEQEEKGFVLIRTEISEASPLIRVTEQQLQCTLPETLTLKVPGGTLVSMSTLVAVSMDGGKNWKFIDASNSGLDRLQENYPTLSNKLKIPDYGKPVFTRD